MVSVTPTCHKHNLAMHLVSIKVRGLGDRDIFLAKLLNCFRLFESSNERAPLMQNGPTSRAPHIFSTGNWFYKFGTLDWAALCIEKG
jgi:hypothetical protein